MSELSLQARGKYSILKGHGVQDSMLHLINERRRGSLKLRGKARAGGGETRKAGRTQGCGHTAGHMGGLEPQTGLIVELLGCLF